MKEFCYFELPHGSREFEVFRLNKKFLTKYLSRPVLPHRNRYQAVIWISQGSGTHTIDGTVFPIEANTLMTITIGQIHQFKPNIDTRGWAIRFTDGFLNTDTYHNTCKYSLFNNLASTSVLRVVEKDVLDYNSIIERLYREYEKPDDFGKYEIIQRFLEILLIKLELLKRNQFTQMESVEDADYFVFQRFNFELENNFQSIHDVASYASKLIISDKKLSAIIQKFIGKSTSQAIQERIITEAKRILLYSDKSVKEIAYDLGYEDPFYFSKVFKRLTGKAPKSFKLEYQKGV